MRPRLHRVCRCFEVSTVNVRREASTSLVGTCRYSRITRHQKGPPSGRQFEFVGGDGPTNAVYTPLDRWKKDYRDERPQLIYGGTLKLTFCRIELHTRNQIPCRETEVFIPLNEADAISQTSLHCLQPLRQHNLNRRRLKSHERCSLHRAALAC